MTYKYNYHEHTNVHTDGQINICQQLSLLESLDGHGEQVDRVEYRERGQQLQNQLVIFSRIYEQGVLRIFVILLDQINTQPLKKKKFRS